MYIDDLSEYSTSENVKLLMMYLFNLSKSEYTDKKESTLQNLKKSGIMNKKIRSIEVDILNTLNYNNIEIVIKIKEYVTLAKRNNEKYTIKVLENLINDINKISS